MSSAKTAAKSIPLDERIAGYAKIGVPITTVAGAVAVGATVGVPMAVLVLAGGTLVTCIAAFWASVRTLVGETPLSGADAYAFGAPRAEEEKKRAILRTLKDLEFERSVGKISEDDYQELVAKYRAEAKRLLRALEEDAKPGRERVEALLIERLREEGLLEGEEPEKQPEPEAPEELEESEEEEVAKAAAPAPAKAPQKKAKQKKKSKQQPAPTSSVCGACGARNDADAVFCKKCGTRRIVADRSAPEDEAGA